MSDETMLRRLRADGHSHDESLAMLAAAEEAEIEEFLTERFPLVKKK